MRNLFQGHTPLVLRPGSVAEVSAILKLANETETAIVPQGGNTGLVGGQIPHHNEIVLSLNRLDRIREVDPTSNTITCEAGVTLQRAREAAAAVDRLYPQLLPSEGTCTIGGNLSTNAGGTAALAYGIARSHALGLEVVLADGRVLNNLNKLKKDNTGYDLKNLFIGAEGTLGIITAAVLRLVPRPRSVETAFAGVTSAEAALELLGIAQERSRQRRDELRDHDAGAASSSCWRTPPAAAIRSPRRIDWYVLIELSSQQRDGLREVLEEHSGARPGARARHRRRHRRQPGTGQGVLAHPRNVRRGAAPCRRLDQARRLGAGRRGAGLYRGGQCRRHRAYSRRAAAALRPSRRRQYPLQRHASRSAPTRTTISSAGTR